MPVIYIDTTPFSARKMSYVIIFSNFNSTTTPILHIMKKILILLILALSISTLHAQFTEHKMNLGFDLGAGPHYFNSDRNNPVSYSGVVGYEYLYLGILSAEVGVKVGGFNQTVGYLPSSNEDYPPLVGAEHWARDIYRGFFIAPFIAPKIYIPVSEDHKLGRARKLFMENRFMYTYSKLDLNRIESQSGKKSNNHFDYEVRLGFLYPLSQSIDANFALGYSTYNFGRIDRKNIKFKNTTPISIGIGISYTFN